MGKLTREFEPFKNLWITAADWQKWYETWMNDSLINVDPELLTNSVNNAFKTMHKSMKWFKSVKLNSDPTITMAPPNNGHVWNTYIASLSFIGIGRLSSLGS